MVPAGIASSIGHKVLIVKVRVGMPSSAVNARYGDPVTHSVDRFIAAPVSDQQVRKLAKLCASMYLRLWRLEQQVAQMEVLEQRLDQVCEYFEAMDPPGPITVTMPTLTLTATYPPDWHSVDVGDTRPLEE